jgi:iron complex outermembrane receptor protein
MRSGGRLGLAGLAGAACAVATGAAARDLPLTLSISSQPREAALLELGRAAGVSLGFAPNARCGGEAGVNGRMTLDAALGRLLAGSPCTASRPDARTVVIYVRPKATPAPQRPTTAAERPEAAASQVGELVVTADKSLSLLSTSPYGLTAVTGHEMERAGVSDLRDLSLMAAGVTVTNLGAGRDKVLLRGLSDGPLTNHTQSTVGLYLGDLRLTYNAPDPDLPLIDIARVEVLRGPQGSLYGAGSIGGIVHIVPNMPDLAARSGFVSVDGADTTGGAGSYGLQAMINQPLPGDAAVRVAAWAESTGGYIDNVATGKNNVNRTTQRGVRALGRWQPTDDLVLDAMFVEQAIDTRDAHYAMVQDGPLARGNLVAEPHDNDFKALSLSAHWSPDWGQVAATVGLLDHDVTTTYDATFAPRTLVPPGARPDYFTDGNEIQGVVGEARISSPGANRFNYMVGLFGAVGDQHLDTKLTAFEPVEAYSEVRRDRLKEGAIFGEASYDVTPNLTLTAGGRLFISRLHATSRITRGAPVRDFEDHTQDKGFAPKLLLAWRPMPRTILYAQSARGFRAAGFNTGGSSRQVFSQPGGQQPLQRYPGDKLWAYEVGTRWRPPGDHLALRVALFQANWRSIQADLVLPSGLPFTADLGDGRSRGVEAEATYVRGGWTLSGNVTHQQPELLSPELGLPRRRDSGLPGVPANSAAASGGYRWNLARDWSLETLVGATYVGTSHLAFDATTTPKMGGYTDVSLSVTARSSELSLRLYVDNLLNSHGDTLAFGNPFSLRLGGQTTPQRPRTAGLKVTREF